MSNHIILLIHLRIYSARNIWNLFQIVLLYTKISLAVEIFNCTWYHMTTCTNHRYCVLRIIIIIHIILNIIATIIAAAVYVLFYLSLINAQNSWSLSTKKQLPLIFCTFHWDDPFWRNVMIGFRWTFIGILRLSYNNWKIHYIWIKKSLYSFFNSILENVGISVSMPKIFKHSVTVNSICACVTQWM